MRCLPTRYSERFPGVQLMSWMGPSRTKWLVVLALAMVALAACRNRHRVLEVAYVSAPQATLRDQVAAIYNRVGTVKNGERVEIIDREKRFARVRTASGIEGWVEQRYLVDQKTFDGLQKLTQENQGAPVQAPGVCAMRRTSTLLPDEKPTTFTSLRQARK